MKRKLFKGVLVCLLLASTYLLLLEKTYFHTERGLGFNDVIEVSSKLIPFTGDPERIVAIHLIESDIVNAWADGRSEITITTGLLKTLHSKDELAAVLGHEMGHIMLGHVSGQVYDDQRLLELNSDKYGVFLMERAGYDKCQADEWFRRLRDEGQDTALTTSHPSMSDRVYEMDFPQCH